MTTKIANSSALGTLPENPELQSEFMRSMLRLAGTGLLGGAALRTVMGLASGPNAEYKAPEPKKPIIVDMPVPSSHQATSLPPVAASKQKSKEANVLGDISEGLRGLWDSYTPTFHAPLGNANAQTAADIPATALIGAPLAVGAGVGGYALVDKLMRSSARNKARDELEAAQKEYQRTIVKRLAESRFPAKSAMDASPLTKLVPNSTDGRIKRALDEVYNIIKSSEEGEWWQRLGLGALFPGLYMGRDAALANMGLAGILGGTAGYLGYNAGRSEQTQGMLRNEMNKLDRANADTVPAPMVARLVPVSRDEEERKKLLGTSAKG